MSVVTYRIPEDGSLSKASDYYPPAKLIAPNPPPSATQELENLPDVVRHYTQSSLSTSRVEIKSGSLQVTGDDAQVTITFDTQDGFEQQGRDFAATHQRILSHACALKAVRGADRMRGTPGAWNPMEGYRVNSHEESLWEVFLPLGMPIANHRSVTLLHYPPYGALQSADYLNNTTLLRWTRLLEHVGIKDESERKLYWSIVDVNPVAAPGSGESEYPNDYFPIMMASVFFDSDDGQCDYIRSMLDVTLNPPHNEDNPYTLPLLVGGSPLYDPQAPGWFRVRYKDQENDGVPALSRNQWGEPQVAVNQAGFVRINPDSRKLTPYMIANHMIAAGVTGQCRPTRRDKAPDIRVYEAQDLVAASFLRQYSVNPEIHPAEARKKACLDWFGQETGNGAPQQSESNPDNLKIICALAQMDLFITYRPHKQPNVVPKYSFEEAMQRCAASAFDPCAEDCGSKWVLTVPNPR